MIVVLFAVVFIINTTLSRNIRTIWTKFSHIKKSYISGQSGTAYRKTSYNLNKRTKKYLWARYGLPPITSSGVDQAPIYRLVFRSYDPPPYSCVLLLYYYYGGP